MGGGGGYVPGNHVSFLGRSRCMNFQGTENKVIVSLERSSRSSNNQVSSLNAQGPQCLIRSITAFDSGGQLMYSAVCNQITPLWVPVACSRVSHINCNKTETRVTYERSVKSPMDLDLSKTHNALKD